MEASAEGTTSSIVPLRTLFADVEEEFSATRRLLERFPDEQASWRPHEKSMSTGALAAHIASNPELGRQIAEDEEWNLREVPFVPSKVRTRAEILELFDRSVEGARKALADLTPEALEASWRMRDGDTVYMEGPRGVLLRRYLISHTAHHRGQLTVYYRLLGVPVPGIYGPTADGM